MTSNQSEIHERLLGFLHEMLASSDFYLEDALEREWTSLVQGCLCSSPLLAEKLRRAKEMHPEAIYDLAQKFLNEWSSGPAGELPQQSQVDDEAWVSGVRAYFGNVARQEEQTCQRFAHLIASQLRLSEASH